MYQPGAYDKTALQEIHLWKDPELGWLGRVLASVSKPINAAGEAILSTPGIKDALIAAINGLIGVCGDAAHWSVRPEAICREFRKGGCQHIHCIGDIVSLELECVDRTVGFLAAKYKGLAMVEGAAAGATGAIGLVADIPTLITLNLRAIGEYATYYGFDLRLQEERLFALNILSLASSPTDGAKHVALAHLVRIAQDVALNRPWQELEKRVFVKVVQQIAEQLGIRITKAKLAQIVPMAGALVGAGYNAYFTARVCEAAYQLYRERFLAKKYGPDVIELTVAPANSFALENRDDEFLPAEMSEK